MSAKIKKSKSLAFKADDPAVKQAAQTVLDKLDALFYETRYLMEENPESKNNVMLWNCLIDVEEAVTDLAEGNEVSEEDVVLLGNNCSTVVQLIAKGELSREEVVQILSPLNNVVFSNDDLS